MVSYEPYILRSIFNATAIEKIMFEERCRQVDTPLISFIIIGLVFSVLQGFLPLFSKYKSMTIRQARQEACPSWNKMSSSEHSAEFSQVESGKFRFPIKFDIGFELV